MCGYVTALKLIHSDSVKSSILTSWNEDFSV